MRRIEELDGLRFLAIFGVFLVHFCPATVDSFDVPALGWAGVDLFFAISGFLITGILMKLRADAAPFKTFYWRRMLRIFPPYYMALAAIVVLAILHGEEILRLDVYESLTFLRSIDLGYSTHSLVERLHAHAVFSTAVLPVARPDFRLFRGGIVVFWSLSVEEIFYLIWAPIVLRGARKTILLCSLLPLFLCPAIRAILHTSDGEEAFAFICRFDSLAAGAAVALWFSAVEEGKRSVRALEVVLLSVIPLSAVALALLSWKCGLFRGMELRSSIWFSIFGFTLLAILFAAVAGACTHWSGHTLLSVLRRKPIAHLGKISYSMYLIHIPVYVAVGLFLRNPSNYNNQLLHALLAIVFTAAVASLSWKYFETPILQFRERPFSPLALAPLFPRQ